jgi:hypothetical protein
MRQRRSDPKAGCSPPYSREEYYARFLPDLLGCILNYQHKETSDVACKLERWKWKWEVCQFTHTYAKNEFESELKYSVTWQWFRNRFQKNVSGFHECVCLGSVKWDSMFLLLLVTYEIDSHLLMFIDREALDSSIQTILTVSAHVIVKRSFGDVLRDTDNHISCFWRKYNQNNVMLYCRCTRM